MNWTQNGRYGAGDTVFIAARPSMGKTELALDIIDKVTEQGHGVLLFTMEMANIQIGERMVSAAGECRYPVLSLLPVLKTKTGHVSHRAWDE